MTWLRQNHLYDSSLIVALSDHGESLGEHGEDEHGFFVYNATVHVPLIVKPPAGSGITAGRQREPVETTAVAPTLLQLAGVKASPDPIHAQFQSHALLETKPDTNHAIQDPAYSETFYPFSSFGWSPLHALESERFHFIEAPKPELYDLETDPGRNPEHRRRATRHGCRTSGKDAGTSGPQSFRYARNAGAGNLSPDAQEKLRALGYFGFRAAVSPESLKARSRRSEGQAVGVQFDPESRGRFSAQGGRSGRSSSHRGPAKRSANLRDSFPAGRVGLAAAKLGSRGRATAAVP